MLDPKTVERIGPDYWRNSQLSVCRFAGAGIINGVKYILDPDTDYLVREDIYKRDMKDAKKKAKVAAAEKAKWMKVQQEGIQHGLFCQR
jgi:hypothetical protein